VVVLGALLLWLERVMPTLGAAVFLLILLVSLEVYTLLDRNRDCSKQRPSNDKPVQIG
jgi:hypothetical protein